MRQAPQANTMGSDRGRVKPEVQDASIVLRGDFNPSVFHPSWLATRGLIGEDEAREAEVSVISSQIAVFRVSWLQIRVTHDLFESRTMDPSHFPSLSELVRGVFSFLEFTPVRYMGMNRRLHVGVRGEEEWHRLGDLWAPKEPWKGVLTGKRPGGLPGVQSLTMEGIREGAASDFVRVTLQPSLQVTPGVFVATNEHFSQPEGESVDTMMELLDDSWRAAQEFAVEIAENLLRESV